LLEICSFYLAWKRSWCWSMSWSVEGFLFFEDYWFRSWTWFWNWFRNWAWFWNWFRNWAWCSCWGNRCWWWWRYVWWDEWFWLIWDFWYIWDLWYIWHEWDFLDDADARLGRSSSATTPTSLNNSWSSVWHVSAWVVWSSSVTRLVNSTVSFESWYGSTWFWSVFVVWKNSGFNESYEKDQKGNTLHLINFYTLKLDNLS